MLLADRLASTVAPALAHHDLERGERRVAERALMKEVLVRVPGQSQLGEGHECRARVGGLARQRERRPRVVLGLAWADVRNGRGDAHEAMAVERAKWAGAPLRRAHAPRAVTGRSREQRRRVAAWRRVERRAPGGSAMRRG